jgi:hypothetical protein
MGRWCGEGGRAGPARRAVGRDGGRGGSLRVAGGQARDSVRVGPGPGPRAPPSESPPVHGAWSRSGAATRANGTGAWSKVQLCCRGSSHGCVGSSRSAPPSNRAPSLALHEQRSCGHQFEGPVSDRRLGVLLILRQLTGSGLAALALAGVRPMVAWGARRVCVQSYHGWREAEGGRAVKRVREESMRRRWARRMKLTVR